MYCAIDDSLQYGLEVVRRTGDGAQHSRDGQAPRREVGSSKLLICLKPMTRTATRSRYPLLLNRSPLASAPFRLVCSFPPFIVALAALDIGHRSGSNPDRERPRSCPLWVKSRHVRCEKQVRFTPNSDINCVFRHVCFGPIAHIRLTST